MRDAAEDKTARRKANHRRDKEIFKKSQDESNFTYQGSVSIAAKDVYQLTLQGVNGLPD